MMSEKEIHDICKNFGISNYSINIDGSVDVNDDVNISARGLTEIPLRFNNVTGYFNCSHNNLTTLKNCPIYVGDWFDCSYNNLTILEGSPNKVREFYCNNNNLKSLIGSRNCDCRYFDCSYNQLTSLDGCSEYIRLEFFCSRNPLTSLDGYNLQYKQLVCDDKLKLIRKHKLKVLDIL